MRTLYGLRQSPWTERARWALDHHRVQYRYHEHVPMLGEVLLRLKAKPKPGQKASVPLLVDGDQVLGSSLDIARHADALGGSTPLFPAGRIDEVTRWADVSDRIIGVGRAQVLAGLRTSREAQREALPPFMPSLVRGALAPSAAAAALFIAKKHGVPGDPVEAAERTLRPALAEVRASLAGRTYLLDAFSFADVAIAASLRALRPEARAELGPATRAIWSNEAFAAEYADLLAWRDALYERHRG